MNLDEFIVASEEELIEYGKTVPFSNTYDSNSNRVTFKSSTGCYWAEYTYDSNNNELTYKNSDGYWCEKTYDSNNKILTHNDYDGNNFELFCYGEEFNLLYNKNEKLYRAGCQNLKYNKCIKFFNTKGKYYIDAELFMDAIHKNENKGN